MAISCGVDIVFIPTIEKMMGNVVLLQKFFHIQELENSKPEHLAGIIAAKEAFFKAYGTLPKFQDVTIEYAKTGKPQIATSPSYSDFKSCDLSISHDNNYAIAFVVLEK